MLNIHPSKPIQQYVISSTGTATLYSSRKVVSQPTFVAITRQPASRFEAAQLHTRPVVHSKIKARERAREKHI